MALEMLEVDKIIRVRVGSGCNEIPGRDDGSGLCHVRSVVPFRSDWHGACASDSCGRVAGLRS